MSAWSWLKRYALNWGVGGQGGGMADRHALVELDLDKHHNPEESESEDSNESPERP